MSVVRFAWRTSIPANARRASMRRPRLKLAGRRVASLDWVAMSAHRRQLGRSSPLVIVVGVVVIGVAAAVAYVMAGDHEVQGLQKLLGAYLEEETDDNNLVLTLDQTVQHDRGQVGATAPRWTELRAKYEQG